MPGRSRSATEERALERSGAMAGRGTQSRGGSLDGHYVAPARSVTAKVPGLVPRLHLPNLWRWSLGTRLVKMTCSLNDIWIM